MAYSLSSISRKAPSIEALAERIEFHKAQEQNANRQRLEAEKQLLAALGEIDAEGTTNVEAGSYKVTIRCTVNRAFDHDVLKRVRRALPEEIDRRLIRWKPEVDLKELRYLQNNEVELYGVVAQAITMKPAKPSISIERVEG